MSKRLDNLEASLQANQESNANSPSKPQWSMEKSMGRGKALLVLVVKLDVIFAVA